MKLTKRQREVLTMLRDDPECDLAYSPGGGWWIGHEQTNGRLANSLIRAVLVNCYGLGTSFERYEINESGRRALEGLPPYCDRDGNYHETIWECMID
jgi:hypothetical protein